MKWAAVAGLWIAASAAMGQSSFEAASIRPALPDDRVVPDESMRFQSSPGRIRYTGVTLKMLISRAYGVKAQQIAGPSWLDSDRFDITATHSQDTKPDELKIILRELLADRFQLQTHPETKQLSVYVLTVAKGGSKLNPPEPMPEYASESESRAALAQQAGKLMEARTARLQSGDFRTNREIRFKKSTVQEFITKMSSHFDRPVQDRTNLTGVYSFQLEWRTGTPKPDAPTLEEAFEQQLGLHLQGAHEPVDVLVVDSASRLPTSN